MYACINVLTKLMYFQQILYLLWVNKYYGYGYGCVNVDVELATDIINKPGCYIIILIIVLIKNVTRCN